MKIFERARRRVKNLLVAPLAELGSWARLARGQIALWRYCVRRLRENNVMAMSSALSFRTIFALVPLVIVGFLVLKTLGVVEDSKRYLHDFLERSGLTEISYEVPEGEEDLGALSPAPERPAGGHAPASGAPAQPGRPVRRITVAEKIESVVAYAESQLTLGRVGPVTAVLLVWTALTLLTTMERSLNRIFEAPRPRGFARRILLYWSALTLGPLVIVLAVRAGSSLVEAVRNIPVLAWTLGPVGWVAPFAVGVLFLASLYTLMPNTRVAFRRAVAGAVLAVPLWGLARWAFSLYVARVGSQSIYGALGLIPLFLMWLNLSWWIFLFGAQVAHAAASVGRLLEAEQERRRPLTPWDDLAAALALARLQAERGGPVSPRDVARALGCSETRAERLLRRLVKGGLVVADGEALARCALAVPPDRLSVARVLSVRCPPPEGSASTKAPILEAVAEVRRRAEADLQRLTLADLAGRAAEAEGGDAS